jgi:hypothetical protein
MSARATRARRTRSGTAALHDVATTPNPRGAVPGVDGYEPKRDVVRHACRGVLTAQDVNVVPVCLLEVRSRSQTVFSVRSFFSVLASSRKALMVVLELSCPFSDAFHDLRQVLFASFRIARCERRR